MGIFNWAVTKTGRMFGYQRIKEDTKFIFDIPKIDSIPFNTPNSLPYIYVQITPVATNEIVNGT